MARKNVIFSGKRRKEKVLKSLIEKREKTFSKFFDSYIYIFFLPKHYYRIF